jgi:hypothetical protein
MKNMPSYNLNAHALFIPGKLILLFLSGILTGIQISAQIPNNAWRDHLSYSHGKQLAEYDDRVFCLTSDGSLYSFNTRDNSIQKHSKINGLSDVSISTIGYSAERKTFVIGYQNGNIDLISNDSIINVPDVKRKLIMGDKSINNVIFRNQYAYLACGFGIVQLDLSKREIRDTYIFGPGGMQLGVNDITFDEQSIYAASKSGIYKADIDKPNLADFNAWQQMSSLPDPNAEYRFVVWFNNKLFTTYCMDIQDNNDIITFNESTWNIWPNNYTDTTLDYIGEQHGYLIVCSYSKTRVYNNAEQLIRDDRTYNAKHAIYNSKTKQLWYAAAFGGLVWSDNGLVFTPDGPEYPDAGDIEIRNGKLWAGGGTAATQWLSYGAYSFINEKWNSYNANNFPLLNGFLNISEISIDPLDDNHIIGGSFGYGIAEFLNGSLTDIIDETDGVLQTVPGYGHGYLRVTGTDFDKEDNLWISTTLSYQAVYRRKAGSDLEPVDLAYNGFGPNTDVGEIFADSEGQIWLLINNKGILVFRETSEGTFQEKFIIVKNQIPELLENVTSIAEDKEGQIWIGTNKGPVVYYSPTEILNDDNITFHQPEIPRNDGTPYVDLLLSTVKINDIAIDGANQKWLATDKSGVFLVSADGKKEIHHFTEENSPLFSNNVLTIAVNDKSGEVYFGTEKGMLSFRGRATEGGDDFGNVYVFPNPVREDFYGDITITGLAADVNVKVTDISGNLVFETKALGGQAIWNGKNFDGQRVHTGIYLVFCTNDDGSKTFVTKLLFIH